VRWKSCANKEARLLLQPSCRMSSSAGTASSGPLGRKFSPTYQCSRNDMEWEWSWWRFLFGALGATVPEVVRLSKIVTGRTEGHLPHFGPQYFAISVMFIGLGGVLAVLWGEHHPLKCLWVGVSLPVIISSIASQIPSR
jgi:hypothetical protein